MALDIKPTRSELINLKRRIKQTSSGYNLLKMKRNHMRMRNMRKEREWILIMRMEIRMKI